MAKKKMSTDDKIAVAGAGAGCGCIGFLVLVKLALVVAIIYGLVELGLWLNSLH